MAVSQTNAPANINFVDDFNRALQYKQILAFGPSNVPLHAYTHFAGGVDAITASDINAVDLTDPRLTDARTPTLHASTHKHGGSDEVATASSVANGIPKAASSGLLDIGWLPTGTSATTLCVGNDARLSDSRTPTAHKSTHATGGTDILLPSDIGAADLVHTHIPSAITGLILSNAKDFSHAANNPALGGQTYYFANASDLAAVTSDDQRLFATPYAFTIIGASITITNPGTFAVGTQTETYRLWNYTTQASAGTIYSASGVNNHNAKTVTINVTGLNIPMVTTNQYSIEWIFGSGFSVAPTAVRQEINIFLKINYASYV
jgi:hypothetical protein